MSNILFVVNRLTGERAELTAGEQSFIITGPSDVSFGVEASQIVGQSAVGEGGQDLLLTLQDGTEILLENFFSFEVDGLASRVLLHGGAATAGPLGTFLGASAISGLAADAAGNASSVAVQSVQAYDTQVPSVTISDDKAATLKAGETVTYTFTFSEDVTGFAASDVTVVGGTKGAFTSVDGKTSYD